MSDVPSPGGSGVTDFVPLRASGVGVDPDVPAGLRQRSGSARAVGTGSCGSCGRALKGRQLRFCSGACRARFSREQKARAIQETINRLARLAGIQP